MTNPPDGMLFLTLDRIGVHHARLIVMDRYGNELSAFFNSRNRIQETVRDLLHDPMEGVRQVHVLKDLDGQISRFAFREFRGDIL